MFKRIVKVVGFVLLGFVLVIGGVIGFMAIRGDFKKRVIKPTAISFSVPEMNLIYDADATSKQVNSFIISAKPEGITETECTIKLSNSLISFVKWQNGEWVDYGSNVFHINEPIYFVVNDVKSKYINNDGTDNYYNVENPVTDAIAYDDGVVEITVKDKSGLLQTKLSLEVDREITSISFKDQSKAINNTINANGKFGYEKDVLMGEEVEQNLEAIMGQRYPLEVITAPLMAMNPINSKGDKTYEIYYVEDNQPMLLSHVGEVVKLNTYDEASGQEVSVDCNFLRYNTEKGCYELNEFAESGKKYPFRLAVYATYEDEERLSSLPLIERLQEMVTKTVVVSVSGTDAEEILFNQTSGVDMKSLEENRFVVNNSLLEGYTDLGLTLLKADSRAEIEGRFNELKFLDGNSFSNTMFWTFKQALITDDNYTGTLTPIPETDSNGNIKYASNDIEIKFYNDNLGNKKATVKGIAGIENGLEYNVSLEKTVEGYNLALIYIVEDAEAGRITFKLSADAISGKRLTLNIEPRDGLATINVNMPNKYIGILRVDLTVEPCLILGDKLEESESQYDFRTLQEGVYLVLMGKETSSSYSININSYFITTVENEYGKDNKITIMPIAEKDAFTNMELYAVVVNSDGSWTYTESSRTVAISEQATKISIANKNLDLPVTVGQTLSFDSTIYIQTLAEITSGSYKDVLLFAPKYVLLDETTAPVDWVGGPAGMEMGGYGFYAKTESGMYVELMDETDYTAGMFYRRNNYSFIENITIVQDGEVYYLLGYVDAGGEFVNAINTTGVNYNSKLYPVVPRTNYSKELGRLQTASEYITQLLKEDYTILEAFDGTMGLKYDNSLLPGRKIYKTNSGKIAYKYASAVYNSSKQYYALNGEGIYQPATPTEEEISAWNNTDIRNKYFELLEDVDILEVSGGTAIVDGMKYYNMFNGVYTEIDADLNDDGITDYATYVVISHYRIDSVEWGAEIIISTTATSDGFELNPTIFTINATKYINKTISHVFPDVLSSAEYITANSYYNFSASPVKPQALYGGSYFGNENSVDGEGIYQIIAGHKTVEVDWNGELAGDGVTPISNYLVNTTLTIESNAGKVIANTIRDKLTIYAIEYNESNQKVGITDVVTIESISMATDNFKKVQGEFDSNATYYRLGGAGTFEVATDVTLDTWEMVKADLYVFAGAILTAEFEVADELPDGHYIRFEWVYNAGNNYFTTTSDRLNVLSREIQGFTVNVGRVSGYAELLTSATAPAGDYYKFENNMFELTRDTYEAGKYYSLVEVERTGDIKYVVSVDYDADYVYIVYATDNAGNYLYKATTTGEGPTAVTTYEAIWSAPNIAFKCGGGGWIKSNPLYAENTAINIVGIQNYLTFNDANEIVSVCKMAEFDDITIVSAENPSATHKIYVKVVPKEGSEGFAYRNMGNITCQANQKTISGIYTYNGNPIDHKLQLHMTDQDFTVARGDDNLSSNYQFEITATGYKISNKNNASDYIEIALNGANWEITRTSLNSVILNIDIISVLKVESIRFEFESPYEYYLSNTNKTTKLYSGTNFVLAKTANEEVELDDGSVVDMANYDALYTLLDLSGSGQFVIKYQKAGEATETALSSSNYKIGFIDIYGAVPNVIEPTRYTFNIYYKYSDDIEQPIDSFDLIIYPNVVITADNIDNAIALDDYQSNKYSFDNLNLKAYRTDIEYLEYSDDTDMIALTDMTNINYEYYTYINNSYTDLYKTNIVNINNHLLKVNSPLNEIGTYYVKVAVTYNAEYGTILVGEVKFEVTSRTVITTESGDEIPDIEITAKRSNTYTLDELKTIYSLQRNNEPYFYLVEDWQEAETFVEGKTYQYNTDTESYTLIPSLDMANPNNMWINKAYKAGVTYGVDNEGNYFKMTVDAGNGYYRKAELSDIFWLENDEDNLDITYTYGEGDNQKQLIQQGYTLTFNGVKYTRLDQLFNNNITFANGVVYNQYSYNNGYLYTEYNGEFVIGTIYYYYDAVNSEWKTTTTKVYGVTYYTKENCVFDTCSRTFKSAKGTVETSKIGNVYYTNLNGISIYCPANTYLFATDADDTTIIALTVSDNGKWIYKLTVDRVNNQITCNTDTAVWLGDLVSITVDYNGFGDDLTNIEYVDNIAYNIEAVFNVDNIRTVVKDNTVYNINVLPYIVEPKQMVLLDNEEYILFKQDGTGLFNINGDANISSISFGNTGDYDLGITPSDSTSRITFYPNGNTYVVNVPVTLTYNDTNNSTFTYNVPFTVVSKTVVSVNYPFSVDNVDTELDYDTYELFTTTFDQVDNAVEGGAYDLVDFAKWLGVDTNSPNWQTAQRIKYDIALREDQINLVDDQLLDVSRYNVYTYTHATDELYAPATYYRYDTVTNSFKLALEPIEEIEDWDIGVSKQLNYYTRTLQQDASVGNFELVAVGNTYASSIPNISLNNNIIAIDNDINLTGYVLLKLYANNSPTSAYGYYILKIVVGGNNEFNNVVISGDQYRNVEEISSVIASDENYEPNTYYSINAQLINEDTYAPENPYYKWELGSYIRANDTDAYEKGKYYALTATLITGDAYNGVYYEKATSIRADGTTYEAYKRITSIINLIRNRTRDIYSVAGISPELIDSNSGNIYLFIVDSNDEFGVNKGELIKNDTIVPTSDNIQELTIAVVAQIGSTSLLHLCNYKLILQPDIKVITGANASVKDANYYEYTSKELMYSFADNNANTVTFDNTYLTVTNSAGDIQALTSISFDATRTNQAITIDGNNIIYAEQIVATINGTQLQLVNPVSEQIVFCLKLSYGGFTAYLDVVLAPFEFSTTTEFIVGKLNNNSFDKEFKLSDVFNDYNKEYTLQYSLDGRNYITMEYGNTYADKFTYNRGESDSTNDDTITFIPDSKMYAINLKVVLTDLVASNIANATKVVTIEVKPSINSDYDATNTAKYGEDVSKPIVTNKVDYSDTINNPVLTSIGSKLYVDISGEGTVKKISICSTTGTVYYTIYVEYFQSIQFKLMSNENDKSSYILSNQQLTTSGNIEFAHIALDMPFRLEMSINYSKDAGATIQTYESKPTLYIELKQTYSIDAVYRIQDATIEYVAHLDKLNLIDDGVDDISTNFFGREVANVAGTVVNPSRISIKVGSQYYAGLYYVKALGLLTSTNPNYLNPLLINAGDSSIDRNIITFRYSEGNSNPSLAFKNDTLMLEYNFTVLENNIYSYVEYNEDLLLVDSDNNGVVNYVSVTHSQLQPDSEGNYTFELADIGYMPNNNGFVYSSNLNLQFGFAINDQNNGKVVVTRNTLSSTEQLVGSGIDVTIVTINGIVSSIKLFVTSLEIKYGYDDNVNYENMYAGTEGYKLTDQTTSGRQRVLINPETYTLMDIPCSNYTYNVTARLLTAEKCSGEYYEYDAYTNTYTQTNKPYVKNKYYSIDAVACSNTICGGTHYFKTPYPAYTYEYLGAVKGSTTHLKLSDTLDYSSTDTKLIQWNEAKQMFNLRSVANDTTITLIFNVCTNSAPTYIIGRICYTIVLKNNIKIGLNEHVSDTQAVDLYLGSYAYDSTEDYTLITTEEDFDKAHVFYIKLADGSYSLVTGRPIWGDGRAYYTTTGTKVNLLASQGFDLITSQSEFDSTAEVYIKVGSTYSLKTAKPITWIANTYYKTNDYYNNLFITLQQYSTNNLISNNKALYNGVTNTEFNTKSVYDFSSAINYLEFSVSDASEGLNVSVDAYGVLTIYGNPEGSFKLKVTSTNGSEYGREFSVRVHPHYNVTAKYNTSIDAGSGAGYASGSEVRLYNTGATAVGGTQVTVNSAYAFNVHYLSNDGITGSSQVLGDRIVNTVYRMKIFDSATGSVLANVVNSDWESVPYQKLTGTTSINLPSVPYSSNPNSSTKYIVAVRLEVTYNGETSYYYARYSVYNEVSVSVNPYYIQKDNVITFNEGAWASGDNSITIMDLNNIGMYSALTPVTVKPEKWDSSTDMINNYTQYYEAQYVPVTSYEPWHINVYYEYNADTGNYTLVSSKPATFVATNYYKISGYTSLSIYSTAPTFVAGKYYKLNDVMTMAGNNNIKALIKLPDGTTYDLNVTLIGLTIKGTLPNYLFKNQTEFTFILQTIDTGAVLLEEAWTIKARTTITYKSSMSLSNFFLQSEIGQEYYNLDIVGLMREWNTWTALSFVNNASSATETFVSRLITGDTTYNLYQVLYKGANSTCSVFTIEQIYYVLVGHETAMSFNFNGGTYYMNLNIDDSEIDANKDGVISDEETSASINLLEMIRIWTYTNNAFTSTIPTTGNISVGINGIDVINVEYSNGFITLLNVNSKNTNYSAYITINAGDINRTIEVIFNIVINAKQLNNNMMPINDIVASAVEEDDDKSLTSEQVDNNLALKQALLSLITFNGKDISTTDNTTMGYYDITVAKYGNDYKIIYNYNNNVSSYTRTLIMSGGFNAKAFNSNGRLAYNQTIASAIETDDDGSLIVTDATLKFALLNLVTLNGKNVESSQYEYYTIILTKGTYYMLTYMYESGSVRYTRTFNMETSAS